MFKDKGQGFKKKLILCSKSIGAKATADRKKGKFSFHFFKCQNKDPKIKLFLNFFLNILILNILQYIILKEKVEAVFLCSKIAAKSAAPILFAAPMYCTV
jgi:hypothetical protein